MRLYRTRVPLFVLWSMLSEHIDQIDILTNRFYYISSKTEISFTSEAYVL